MYVIINDFLFLSLSVFISIIPKNVFEFKAVAINSHFYFMPFLRSRLMRIVQVPTTKDSTVSLFIFCLPVPVLQPNLQIDCKIKVNVTANIKFFLCIRI